MNTQNSWQVEIKKQMKVMRITQERLAEYAGISPGMMSHIVTGKRRPSLFILQKIYDVLGIADKPIFISLESGLEHIDFYDRMRVPIIGWGEIINWQDAKQVKMDSNINNVFLMADEVDSKYCFGLCLKDDSMSSSSGRSFPEGSYILVNTKLKPVENSYVLASLDESGSYAFRQYLKEGKKIYLRPLNHQYDKIEVTEDIRIEGVVTKCELKLA